MKILHTSDWHLGRTLYGRKRYDEFAAFLDWLLQTIAAEQVDTLLVAGDVFDTSTPSNRAQALYYQFLHRVAGTCCRHVVIIAGNHDSPSFLDAPRQLLLALNVHVVAAVSEDLADEMLLLQKDGVPEAIVCAVPYLRDKDIRTVEAGETIDDKNAKLINGLQAHYAEVCSIAEIKRRELVNDGHKSIPVIAMGHLFSAGGKTVDGDGVRELYVGSLAHVGKDVFPSVIDYLALGHLHVPQTVGGASHIRYCGSPIPMGYGEATQRKKVVLVEFSEQTNLPEITELPVPCFQVLKRIVGDLAVIFEQIDALKQQNSTAWLEIEYTGTDLITHLHQVLEEAIIGTSMEIRRIKNRRIMNQVIQRNTIDESLDDLDPDEVFTRCLDAAAIEDNARPALKAAYAEIRQSLYDDDKNAD